MSGNASEQKNCLYLRGRIETTAEPVGQDAGERTEEQRACELGKGDEADQENRVRQLVGEHDLGGVLQPCPEVRHRAAREVPAEGATVAQQGQGARVGGL